jgi:hypothetical protein
MTFSKLLAMIVAVGCLSIVVGCKQADAEAKAAAQSPKPKMPDATPSDRAKAIDSNPNISPEVKKVIGGGGKGL